METALEALNPCVLGLDVHRDMVTACLLTGELDLAPTPIHKTFSMKRAGIAELREMVEAANCRKVVMESTGIYWQPVYNMLEDCFDGDIDILVVNARHVKNLPGRKTDVRDAQWLAMLLRAGLLSGSFIPAKPWRELREYTRYRKAIVHDITTQKNRIDKMLQKHGFKLSEFLRDIFGVSGSAIITTLFTNGVITRAALERDLHKSVKHKIDDILLAMNGTLSVSSRLMLKTMFEHLQSLKTHLSEVERAIADKVAQHDEAMDILVSITGISNTSASAILAEIGDSMEKFPTSEHIASWAGLSPGNNKSAGKSKNAHITKGNPYLKSMLCEVAWSITRSKDSYLAVWYRKVKACRGSKRAIVALARKLLVTIYAMLKNKTRYNEDIYNQRRQASEQRRANRMIRELSKLGYVVSLSESANASPSV